MVAEGFAGLAGVRRGKGLPRAGDSLFQTAPVGPLQGTAEPITKICSAVEQIQVNIRLDRLDAISQVGMEGNYSRKLSGKLKKYLSSWLCQT